MKDSRDTLFILFVLGCAFCAGWFTNDFEKEAAIESVIENTVDSTIAVSVDTNRIVEPYLAQINQLNEQIEVNHFLIDSFCDTKNGKTDTVYQEKIVKIYLDKEQKKYSGQFYDLWISGYKPILDSINIYHQTEYKTITNTINRIETKKEWAVYGSVGVNSIGKAYYPTFGLLLTTRQKLAFSASVGAYQHEPMYQLSAHYKIFHR